MDLEYDAIYENATLICPDCGGEMYYDSQGSSRESFCICDNCKWMLEVSLYHKIAKGIIKYRPGDKDR